MRDNYIIKRKCGNKFCIYVYPVEFFQRTFIPIDFHYCNHSLSAFYVGPFLLYIKKGPCLKKDCKFEILYVIDQINEIIPLYYLPHRMFLKSFKDNDFYDKYFFIPYFVSFRDTICKINRITPYYYYVEIYYQDVFAPSIFMLHMDIFKYDVEHIEKRKFWPRRFRTENYSHLLIPYPLWPKT